MGENLLKLWILGEKMEIVRENLCSFPKKNVFTFLAWNKVGKIYKSQKPRRGKFIIRLNYFHPCLEMMSFHAAATKAKEMKMLGVPDPNTIIQEALEHDRICGGTLVDMILGQMWEETFIVKKDLSDFYRQWQPLLIRFLLFILFYEYWQASSPRSISRSKICPSYSWPVIMAETLQSSSSFTSWRPHLGPRPPWRILLPSPIFQLLTTVSTLTMIPPRPRAVPSTIQWRRTRTRFSSTLSWGELWLG